MVLTTFEYAGQSDSSESGSQDRVLGDDEAIQNLAHIGSGDRAVFACGGVEIQHRVHHTHQHPQHANPTTKSTTEPTSKDDQRRKRGGRPTGPRWM